MSVDDDDSPHRKTSIKRARLSSPLSTSSSSRIAASNDSDARLLANLSEKGAAIHEIAKGSWVAHVRGFRPPASAAEFLTTWKEHPDFFRKIKMFGRDVDLPRWQQAYGKSYQFSGAISDAVDPTPLVASLTAEINSLVPRDAAYRFNMVLCNWYGPEHYIGPHSDDTRQLVPRSPIASVSWGRTRTFVLTPIKGISASAKGRSLALDLKDGDLVIMGGTCQETHKHEVLKLRKGDVGNRINFTFRCFAET